MSSEDFRHEHLGFDPEELRRKYRTECDKRLRDEGPVQHMAGQGREA